MNRTDLVNALLKYSAQPQTGSCTTASPCSELLRLNLAVAPTQILLANSNRLIFNDFKITLTLFNEAVSRSAEPPCPCC